jgi:hypothetical protein
MAFLAGSFSPGQNSCDSGWIPRLRIFLSIFLLAVFSIVGRAHFGIIQTSSLSAAPVKLSRDQVISYFLLNCLHFGSWPTDFDPYAAKAVRIGILGKNKIGPTLESVFVEARARWFSGGRVEVINSQDPRKLLNCQIIFFDEIVSSQMGKALDQFKGLPIILVSDLPGFLEAGGVSEIQIQEGRFTFNLNLDQLTLRGIDLASNMKDLAVSIFRDGKREPNPRRRKDS